MREKEKGNINKKNIWGSHAILQSFFMVKRQCKDGPLWGLLEWKCTSCLFKVPNGPM